MSGMVRALKGVGALSWAAGAYWANHKVKSHRDQLVARTERVFQQPQHTVFYCERGVPQYTKNPADLPPAAQEDIRQHNYTVCADGTMLLGRRRNKACELLLRDPQALCCPRGSSKR